MPDRGPDISAGGPFSIENLPYGSFRVGGGEPRLGVAFGDSVLDLLAAQDAGLMGELPKELFDGGNLDAILATSQETWSAVRQQVKEVLGGDCPPELLTELSAVEMCLPFSVGDYVDFYSSLQHATNLGRMFRPGGDPLLPNWRHLPIGYHGRSSTIVVSDTPVVRPWGQLPGDEGPRWAPTERLDIELELGFVTGGPPNELGQQIPIDEAGKRVFGFLLVNDWSARDIQRWEYQPLGPYLGKSFATSIAPWVVPVEALDPFRVAGPVQEPAPLDYLRTEQQWAFDIELEVELNGEVVSRTNARGLYWNAIQQLAHAASNGTVIRAGDLYASGTISGDEPGSYGSFIELTANGDKPLKLKSGQRTFLGDGDTIVLRGQAGDTVGFGEVRGTVAPATR